MSTGQIISPNDLSAAAAADVATVEGFGYFTKTYTIDSSHLTGESSWGVHKVVLTLTNWSGTEEFKIEYPKGSGQKTTAFVRGTNGTAAAIQTALRTLTGDTGLTVAGTTDAGPFSIRPSTIDAFDIGYISFNLDLFDVTDETGDLAGSVTYSIRDFLLWPNNSGYAAERAASGEPIGDQPESYDTSRLVGQTNFAASSPVKIYAVGAYVTTGAGMTYQLVDLEWGSELCDEGDMGSAKFYINPPAIVNGLVFVGDLFEENDVMDIYVWYAA